MHEPQEDALFGRWLRRRRKLLDLTQKGLATRVGCSAATIRKLESEERHASRRLALQLARALGVPEGERRAFVRFARGGWADRPPTQPLPDLERPWAGGPGGQGAAGRRGRDPQVEDARAPGSAEAEGGGAPPVVARDAELARLRSALGRALAGEGGVQLVAGEAGQGKTTLLRAFAAEAQAEHPDLLVATGSCNAFTGAGDPFQPFRDVLRQLGGDVGDDAPEDEVGRSRAERLGRHAPNALRALVDVGRALVGTLLPVEEVLERLERAGIEAPRAWRGAPDRGDLPAGPRQAGELAAVRTATARVLLAVADRAPLLIVLDDLQWADASSAEALHQLARTVTGHRVLVLGAYRPADLAAGEPAGATGIARTVHELERTHGDVVVDLDRADGRGFLDAWLDTQPNALGEGFREALMRQTSGQPLFTVELLRALQQRGDLVRGADGRWSATASLRWDALPRRVNGVLAVRVDRLDAEAREVLRVASVEGELFTAELVAGVLEMPPRRVVRVLGEQLAGRERLVRPVDSRRAPGGLVSRYRFGHNLIQRYVYESIDANERAYLHEAVAEGLEGLFGDEAEPVAMAFHLGRAGASGRAARYQRMAGDSARRAGALGAAVEAYTAALASWPRSESAPRAALLRDLGECRWLLGERSAALGILEEAQGIFERSADVESAAAVGLTIGRVHYESGDWERALEITKDALHALEGRPESAALAAAQARLATLYMTAQRAEAAEWSERALASARRTGAEDVRADALDTLGTCLMLDPERREEALAMLEESHRIADRLGLAFEATRALYNHGYTLRALGRLDEARRRWEELLAYAERHPAAYTEAGARYRLWQLAWRQGRWGEAWAERSRILELADGTGVTDSALHPLVSAVASVDVDVGRFDEARSLLGRFEEVLERVVEPQYRSPYLREQLRIAAAQGRTGEADRLARAIVETGRGRGQTDALVPPVLSALQWLASRDAGPDMEAAERCLRDLQDAHDHLRSDEAGAAVAEGRGWLAGAAGTADAAARAHAGAASRWHACGFPLDEARARVAAARALRAAGDGPAADAEHTAARRLLRGLAGELPSEALKRSFARMERAMLSPEGTGLP